MALNFKILNLSKKLFKSKNLNHKDKLTLESLAFSDSS